MFSKMNKKSINIKGVKSLYWAVIAIFFACFVAGFLAINIAANEANEYAGRAERSLVHAEIEYLTERAIREQAEASFWDETIQNVVVPNTPNSSFVQELFTDWLISEFDFSEFTLINAENDVVMIAPPQDVNKSNENSNIISATSDLVALARKHYEDQRYKIGSKFMVDSEDGEIVPEIQAYAFRNWNGVPSIIIAQVMIAESLPYAPRDGEETVLISVKPLSPTFVSSLAAKIGIDKASIASASEDQDGFERVNMPDLAAASSLAFNWQPNQPRAAILTAALPVAATATIFLAIILTFVLRNNAMVLGSLARSEAHNKFLATHDTLTGLANREKFENALNRAVDVYVGQKFCVMFIDLDKFKQANDQHGHDAGDLVLQTIAERISKGIAEKGLVARIGGDEFVALITANLNDDEIRWLADRLIDACCKPIQFENTNIQVGASVGIAMAPHDGSTPNAILKAADNALYYSKRNGRGLATMWKEVA